jgi:hypothetical protein
MLGVDNAALNWERFETLMALCGVSGEIAMHSLCSRGAQDY